MLTYIEAQLHPEKFATQSSSNASARTLSSALVQSHELKAEAGANMRVAYAWLHIPETGDYWHNGGTGGYSSYCFFNPKEDYGAIVLMNAASVGNNSFADLLGQHISQRFAGKPAVALP
jgi:serine-type D-Ala-D-Ala carboxypeptidase/endopeptidase